MFTIASFGASIRFGRLLQISDLLHAICDFLLMSVEQKCKKGRAGAARPFGYKAEKSGATIALHRLNNR